MNTASSKFAMKLVTYSNSTAITPTCTMPITCPPIFSSPPEISSPMGKVISHPNSYETGSTGVNVNPIINITIEVRGSDSTCNVKMYTTVQHVAVRNSAKIVFLYARVLVTMRQMTAEPSKPDRIINAPNRLTSN